MILSISFFIQPNTIWSLNSVKFIVIAEYNVDITFLEATTSATPSSLSALLTNPVFAYIVGGIGGIFFTILTKAGEAKISEVFENRKDRKATKRLAARDINSFVIEGMHTGFRHKAGSELHILFRATEIDAIDVEVGEKLRAFLNLWSQHSNFLKYKENSSLNERNAMTFRQDAENLGKELLKTAKDWSK